MARQSLGTLCLVAFAEADTDGSDVGGAVGGRRTGRGGADGSGADGSGADGSCADGGDDEAASSGTSGMVDTRIGTPSKVAIQAAGPEFVLGSETIVG
ncbi:hypothetical protein SLS62_006379 [Diatrype stigma]|uniref:Uncharacterized protein n=1 Tax=Diatrype stigma TaxID=117547 RepID=A0AAN9V1A8_9PEZI